MPEELMYDLMDRTATPPGVPTSGGPAWRTPSGVSNMTADGGYLQPSGQNQSAVADYAVASTDQQIWAIFNGEDNGSVFATMFVRSNGIHSGVYPNTAYFLAYESASVVLRRVVNGSITGLGAAISVVVGDEIGLIVRGTTLMVVKNGVMVQRVNDASIPSGGYVGFSAYTPGSGKAYFSRIRVAKSSSSYDPLVTPRLAYDRDGTVITRIEGVGYNVTQGYTTQLTLAERQTIQDSDYNSLVSIAHYGRGYGVETGLALAFPEPRNIKAIYATGEGIPDNNYTSSTNYDPWYPQYSQQAVGTPLTSVSWVAPGLSVPLSNPIRQPTPVDFPNVTFLRLVRGWIWTQYMRSLHIYATIPENSTSHRLAFWHPFINMALPGDYLDMDDVGWQTTRTRQFRVKNTSQSLTMNSIVISASDLDTPNFAGQVSFNAGSGFVSSVSIASLAPGALSSPITVRRVTAINDAYILTNPRVDLAVGSFS